MAQVISAQTPAQAAAGATVVTEIGIVSTVQGTDNYVTRMEVVSPTLVTGVNTNTATINIRVIRAGAVAFTLGSLALVAGTNLPAETPVNVPITATQAQLSSMQQGDVIDAQLVQAGTGLALPQGIVVEVEIS